MHASARAVTRAFPWLFGVSLLSAFISSIHAQSYIATDLGTLGGALSEARAINATGTIVGFSTTSGDAAFHAFSYSNGTMTDLGTLGGAQSEARAINATGTIVGSAYTSGNVAAHAFSYSNGTMTDLGTLGGTESLAYGINATGTIVGYSYTSGDAAYHAFSYSNGTMTDLGTLGGRDSYARAINATGTIVGSANPSGDGNDHAFSYSNGTMTDLGTLGGAWSRAYGINATGTIVGTSMNSNLKAHAFSYSNGVMTDLGTLGGESSEAYGINATGTIVGYSTTTSGFPHAFIYRDGVMKDLNSLVNLPDVILYEARGINDLGWIIANGSDSHAYLLTPIASVIPEPQGYWKNTPDAWPVDSLMLGSQTYSKTELLQILKTPVGTGPKADASLILAQQLIAALLNLANGADDPDAVVVAIDDADALLSGFSGKLPYTIKPSSTIGQAMTSYARTLESYNKGNL